jgi:site-specific DNA recombinase
MVKSGRYTGWKAPLGYQKIKKTSSEGKQYNVLDIDESEIGHVKSLFDRYLDWQSLTKMCFHFVNTGIKTRNGFEYNTSSIKYILTHPIYATADKHAYEYFKALGAQIYDPIEKWDGTKGVFIYRHSKKQGRHKDPGTWLIGVGEHKPIISSEKWIHVQNIIESRRTLQFPRPFGSTGLLNGIIRCANCGDSMRPSSKSAKTGYFYYVCNRKERSRTQQCNIKNIRGDVLDRDIIDRILTLLDGNFEDIKTKKVEMSNRSKHTKATAAKYRAEIKKNESAIKTIVMQLAEIKSATATKYIANQIEELDTRNDFLRNEISKLEARGESIEIESMNFAIVEEAIKRISSEGFAENEFAVRRNILKTLVKTIEWDGENITVYFH